MSNRTRLRAPDRQRSRARTIPLRESTAVDDVATAASTIAVAEASTGTMTTLGGNRYRALLIEGERWGSSGYYPAEVLERDGPLAWPAGTFMYLDHPTPTEEAERPERSVRDLAAQIVTTPVYEGGGLYAEVQIFRHVLPLVESVGSVIGLSIRANATADLGTVDGRTGYVLESLIPSRLNTVDIVTLAGAGGKFVSLFEAARDNPVLRESVKRTIGAYLEAQLHLAFTEITDPMYSNGQVSRDERITLSSAIGDALVAFAATIESQAPQLFARDIWDGPADDDTTSATESVRQNAGLASTLGVRLSRLREASTNEVQCALDAALVAAYGDDGDLTQWIYVLDFDPNTSTVWYAVSDNQSRTCWQQNYVLSATDDALTSAALADERIQVVARTEYVPVPPDQQAPEDTDGDADTDTTVTESAVPIPVADTPPTPVTDGTPPDVSTQPVEEGTAMSGTQNTGVPDTAGTNAATPAAVTEAVNARALAEAAAAESDRRATEAETRLARFEAVEAARPIATTLIAESQLPPAARVRVMERVTANVPMTDANALNEAAFRTAVTEAVTAEETYLAEVREGAGEGQVTGLGGSSTGDSTAEVAASRTALAERYIARGMSPDAAKIAANGRP